jgi:hypothetical protein
MLMPRLARLLRSPILLILTLSSTLCTSAEIQSSELAKSFETTAAQPWKFPLADGLASRVALPSADVWNLSRVKGISINAWRQRIGAAIRLRWVIESRVGGEYCTAPAITVGAASAVIPVDLRPGTTQLIPNGHQRPWDALAAAEVTRIELRAEGSPSASALNEIAAVNLNSFKIDPLPKGKPNAVLTDVSIGPAPSGYNAAATLRFRIDPEPEDPFAPTGDADVRVGLANGQSVLAFLDQDYSIIEDGAFARRVPIGRPYWRAFLPALPENRPLTITGGGRQWSLSLDGIRNVSASENFVDPNAEQDLIDRYGSAQPSSRPPVKGDEERSSRERRESRPEREFALRWSAPLEVKLDHDLHFGNAPTYWTLSAGGSWHPPVAMASPLARSAFRPVLFWNPKWGNFGGPARPDLSVALQMDAALESAARAGVSQPLVILDGQTLEREGVFNWDTHPLRGTIKGPGEVFHSDIGLDYSTRTMRYLLARWGLSKAISGFWITAQLQAPSAPLFHAKIASLLAAWPLPKDVPVISLNPLACDPTTVQMIGSFTPNDPSPLSHWGVDKFSPPATESKANAGSDGGICDQIVSNDPRYTHLAVVNAYETKPFGAAAPDNFFDADTILFDVWIPPEAPSDLRIGVHVRDRNGFWFQTLLPGMARPGDWTTYAFDITGRNAQKLSASAPKRAWNDYSRQRISEIGIHLYSTHPNWSPSGVPMPLSARFDNVRAVRFPHQGQVQPAVTIERIVPTASGTRPWKAADAAPVYRGDLWECHVKVSKTFVNPFDPCECDLSAVITTPSGRQYHVPAFFDQLWERHAKTAGGPETIEPVGDEFFTARFRTNEPGPHEVAFELREKGRYEQKLVETQHDSRFTPDGQAQVALGGHWPEMVYNRNPNGQRRVERVKFIPGNVTATLKLDGPAFVVADQLRPGAKPFHGFVRVASDKRHFTLDDGTFYYPMGPCLRSPSDSRLPYADPKWTHEEIDRIGKRGTYQYDDYIKSFGDSGITWARVWMCPWWGALEWRRDWPGYQGLGRYNLLNAWRIDHILNIAEQNGIKIDLGLTNHGQFTLDIDKEWKDNPFNTTLGGPLVAPCEFFTRAEAKIAEMNKLRYVVARYSHSPSLFAWSLCSEMEFTEEYETHVHYQQDDTPANNIVDWTREMASYLKAIDPNKHLVTTHFSHPMRGAGTLQIPELDFATSNAYSAFEELTQENLQHARQGGGQPRYDASEALATFWAGNQQWCDMPGVCFNGFQVFQKPALVEEQGRHWMGFDEKTGKVNNTRGQLDADLHAGLWGSMVQPLAGATGYWWWLHVHFDNRYSEYKALANFMEGEDMRPQPGESALEPALRRVDAPNGQMLYGRALKSDRRMYAWVYSPGMPLGEEGEVNGATLNVSKLRPGTYAVECWDTYKGTIISTQEAVVANDSKAQIQLKLPVVKNDIAIKIKPKK